ncbi:hypothetical protein SAMN05444000_108115 [Shimia gijangensis]|uniref:Type IV pilus biogenesis protein PilP n=1 Tax=Shimia gijangensis TaxID=1470563 RepID=A0A1M6J5S0_9RHOB|nr:hypothetical protein [Shimia gijangensis]SHJ42028.1 hypothetical protein SAMN05444000_108115 [Shimia gijangensis]
MKPDFALSLSFEGISLLCRAQDGWRVLGEVDLGAEDLATDLEAMRALAEDLKGPDFCTKLILPNDQIKYLTVDTGRGSQTKRMTAVHLALEAETPYSSHELAIDIIADGRHTHVAAVARDTLAEAEAFAVEHRFNPVCFVAIPSEGTYPQEPQFGETTVAVALLGGQKHEADTDPIRITGHGVEPAPDPATVEPIAETAPAPEVTPTLSNTGDTLPDPSVTPGDQVADGPTIKFMPVARDEPSAEDVPALAANKDENSDPSPSAFSSIRAHRKDAPSPGAPELGAALPGDVTGTNAPGLPSAHEASAHSEAPLRFDPTKIIEGLKSSTGAEDETGSDSKSGSFLSRRADRKAASKGASPAVVSSPVPILVAEDVTAEETPPSQSRNQPASERRNMAIFGARDGEIGGKPRHLGLILTIVLLLFLAGVALWASLFVDDGIAGLLRRNPVPQIAELEVESTPTETVAPAADPMETNALSPVGIDSLTDSAEIEALTNDAVADALLSEDPLDLTDSAAVEAMTDAGHPTTLSENEAEARYAVTGIWERAPQQPDTPAAGSTETLYVTSIDRLLAVRDAVALPQEIQNTRDWAMARQTTPPPQGTTFDLDENGLVRATVKGAMSPEGVMVYLGKPSVLPGAFPERKPAPGETVTPQMVIKLGKLRPKLRPGDLIEKNERASYGGRTLNELALKRPRLRPALAKATDEQDTTPTEAAVVASLRPRQRPANIAQIAARATPADPVVATPVAAIVSPKIPSSASVARQATIQNAINLKKINLIGVYGTASSRRALVRMSNGRYKKVQVGDRIDGGKVAAISDTELRYVKSGKNVVLKLPKG